VSLVSDLSRAFIRVYCAREAHWLTSDQYGVLICVRCHDVRNQDMILGFAMYMLIPCSLFAGYVIELLAAQQAKASRLQSSKRDGTSSPTEDQSKKFRATWHLIAWAHSINVTLALIVTSWVVYHYIHHPLIGTLTEMHAVIVWLKTASWALTNRDLRHAYLHPQKGELAALPEIYSTCPYPENITISNLCYFWWAPTLIYQPAYPRTDRIRWFFVAKRLGEVVCLGVFMWVLSAQYAAPTLLNSLDKIASLDLPSILERLLKLSTISLVIWLAGFFALFQSFLNALAEVMRFADRAFYDDWWNSDSVGTYWRTWNKPVYQYFRRHVFSPLIGRGWSTNAASMAVFIVSALLHEILVGIPTHNIICEIPLLSFAFTVLRRPEPGTNAGSGVAFLGMMAQLPLIALTRPLEKRQTPTGRLIGNCIFWVSFTVFGQPFAILIYFYAWQAKYGSVSKTWSSSSS
jgi:diacylglycerol O-acyltransferase-1